MKLGKWMMIAGLMAMFGLVAPISGAMAGEGGGTLPEVVGPEYWAVVVLDTVNQNVTLRVKRVVDCTVETQANAEGSFTLVPTNGSSDVIYYELTGVTLFEHTGQTPIITKVKNWYDSEDGIYSFDAQIKFVAP